jgi:glutathione S-transferase
MILVVGNKRFSSWSLRPWILMKHFDIAFEERLIPLDQETTSAEIARYSPSGKVPALIDGDITIWESLAIAEYLNEKFPNKQMWPADRRQRAWARAISNEMHAGFQTMREHLPHDLQKRLKTFDWSVARVDIERVQQIWAQCLRDSKGPFLFGEFSIADAMYAPVANRFVSYGVPVEGEVAVYVDRIRSLAAHKLWIDDGVVEKLLAPKHE